MKAALKTLIVFAILISPFLSLKAQTYSFETKQQPYKYLVNPSPITKRDTAWYSTYTKKFPIGATWKAYKTAIYDSFSFDTKGEFYFDNKVDTFKTSMAMFFMPGNNAYFTDKGTWPQPAKSFISSAITGAAGSRIVKVEFRNMGIRGGDTKDSLNFQVWLYEQNGDVEYHYGSSYIADPNYVNGTYTGPSIGIATVSKNYTIMDLNLVYGDPASPKLYTNKSQPTTETIKGFPANGTVYRFKRASAGISCLVVNKHILVQPVSNNAWKITSSKEGKFTYRIVNTLGQQILAGQGSTEVEINLQGYATGIYILSIDDKEVPVITKLIKQ
jgi:hypothetical protein